MGNQRAYEAYKVITDPNASNLDKAIAAAGVLPGGKLLKYADKAVDAVKAMKAVSKACCFVAGTLVATETGLRPIESIEVGDKVLARDESTGQTKAAFPPDGCHAFSIFDWPGQGSPDEFPSKTAGAFVERTTREPGWWWTFLVRMH